MSGAKMRSRAVAGGRWREAPQVQGNIRRRFVAQRAGYSLLVLIVRDPNDEAKYVSRVWGRIEATQDESFDSVVAGMPKVVLLVPARTDTNWWHDYAMKGEIEFLRRRVAFVRSDGERSRAPFPSAIVVFRSWQQVREERESLRALRENAAEFPVNIPARSGAGDAK